MSVRSVDMGAGDDTLWLYSMGRGTIDGGPGRDHWIGTSCLTARVRIDESFLCVPGSNTSVTLTFGFDDWEDVLVRDGGHKLNLLARQALRAPRGNGNHHKRKAKDQERAKTNRQIAHTQAFDNRFERAGLVTQA